MQTNGRKLAFIHSPEIEAYSYPPDCPFKSQRSARLREKLASLGLLDGDHRSVVAPRPATRNELETFHTARYLEVLQRAASGDFDVEGLYMGLGTPDTPIFRDVYQCGSWFCGATLTGAELILGGAASIVFNPSGGMHHAHEAKAGGFCYLNDVVVGCMKLAGQGKRVFCLDLDAHHGDGTEAAFYRRNDVLYVSMHESGETLFPGTGSENDIGEAAGLGYTVNVPLPAGTFDAAYMNAFRKIVPPLLGAYDPGVIVLEIGMDTLAGDPLTHLCLTNNVYPKIVTDLMSFNKPILVVGGGGYHVGNTVRGWARAWQTLCGEHDECDLSAGMGGVMLESMEWLGGLQDRELLVSEEQRCAVNTALNRSIHIIGEKVFPLHGLKHIHL